MHAGWAAAGRHAGGTSIPSAPHLWLASGTRAKRGWGSGFWVSPLVGQQHPGEAGVGGQVQLRGRGVPQRVARAQLFHRHGHPRLVLYDVLGLEGHQLGVPGGVGWGVVWGAGGGGGEMGGWWRKEDSEVAARWDAGSAGDAGAARSQPSRQGAQASVKGGQNSLAASGRSQKDAQPQNDIRIHSHAARHLKMESGGPAATSTANWYSRWPLVPVRMMACPAQPSTPSAS